MALTLAPIKGGSHMSNNKPARALWASAMALTLAFSTSAFGQSMTTQKTVQAAHQRTLKVLAENEKVVVSDVVYQPGDTGAASLRDGLVVYHLPTAPIKPRYPHAPTKLVPLQL